MAVRDAVAPRWALLLSLLACAPATTQDSDTDAALPDGVRSLRVVVQRAGTAIDRVSLITDGGRVLVTHPVEAGRVVWQDTLTPGTWVAALAWSTTGDAWAVTAPTWLRSPAAVPDEVP